MDPLQLAARHGQGVLVAGLVCGLALLQAWPAVLGVVVAVAAGQLVLRGRALAGIHGDDKAGIFCRELHAELLSVAGNYKRLEDIDPRLLGTTVQVQLFDGQLGIKPLG